VTIAIWIIVGVLSGLLFRALMPVPKDKGNALAAGVGVVSAVLAGTLSAIVTNTGVVALNSLSIGSATIGAMYVLFGYRCLAMRNN
jgi:uncharacterized membrane protein YeaQ/YmgE (transglycosylase-associated protein family)